MNAFKIGIFVRRGSGAANPGIEHPQYILPGICIRAMAATDIIVQLWFLVFNFIKKQGSGSKLDINTISTAQVLTIVTAWPHLIYISNANNDNPRKI
jgi:hypothetical protein